MAPAPRSAARRGSPPPAARPPVAAAPAGAPPNTLSARPPPTAPARPPACKERTGTEAPAFAAAETRADCLDVFDACQGGSCYPETCDDLGADCTLEDPGDGTCVPFNDDGQIFGYCILNGSATNVCDPTVLQTFQIPPSPSSLCEGWEVCSQSGVCEAPCDPIVPCAAGVACQSRRSPGSPMALAPRPSPAPAAPPARAAAASPPPRICPSSRSTTTAAPSSRAPKSSR